MESKGKQPATSPARASVTTKAACFLVFPSLSLLAFHALLPSGGVQPHAKPLLAASAGLWSVIALLYGIDRPFLKLSIATAGAHLLRALAYLLPAAMSAGWTRALLDVLVVGTTFAWIRFVVFPKVKRPSTKNRAQRRHPTHG